MPAVVPDSLDLEAGRAPMLLPRAIRLVADGSHPLATRGYGAFDDRAVGADVVAHVDLLDEVESALRAAVADVPDPAVGPPDGPCPPIG